MRAAWCLLAAGVVFALASAATTQAGSCVPRWRISKAPRFASDSVLLGVAAASAGDVWAVGVRAGGEVYEGPVLVDHWDGKRWAVVPTPSVGSGILNSVVALSSRDVWAVGAWRPPAARGALGRPPVAGGVDS
jgi:hypothetical protein